MFRRILSSFLLAMALVATAVAAVTEVSKSFPNQTAALAASAIMAAPAADANYLLCLAITTNGPDSPPSATFGWTDENGNAQSATLPSGSGCVDARNKGNTAPTIAVPSWTGSSLGYNVYVFGLGFWPGGTQGQGGITETVNATFTPGQSSTNLSGNSLVAVTATSGTGCSWSVGSVTGSGAALFPIRIVGSVDFFNSSSGCNETVVVVHFGTPSTGSGPLTDYESTLLNWTSASWPTSETVFTAGSTAKILLLENIAALPGSSVAEGITSTGYSPGGPCSALLASSGNPSSCLSPATVAASTALSYYTYNTTGQKWGTSPTYSAEVDVIQF